MTSSQDHDELPLRPLTKVSSPKCARQGCGATATRGTYGPAVCSNCAPDAPVFVPGLAGRRDAMLESLAGKAASLDLDRLTTLYRFALSLTGDEA